VGDLRITRLELTGTYAASMGPMGPNAGGGEPLADYALFAAVLESPGGPSRLDMI
jgi:hypothetical protein